MKMTNVKSLFVYFSSIEWRAFMRFMRCVLAQGIMRALMWIVLVSAAGYAAYKILPDCPPGQTCFVEWKSKSR